MTIKELSKYYYINLELNKIENRIKELESTIISSSKISEIMVDSSHNGDPVSQYAEKHLKLITKYVSQKEKLIDEEIKLNNYIQKVDDIEVRNIIRLRFLELKSWDDVGKEMICDRTTAYKKLINYLRKEK